MQAQCTLKCQTQGRGLYDITHQVQEKIDENSINSGLCHLFIQHTSASLIINENYDPKVLDDLNTFFNRLVPDGDKHFKHTMEGPDDMPAHVRSALTSTSLSIPIIDGQLGLGHWQGIFVWEHRHRGHMRQVIVTLS